MLAVIADGELVVNLRPASYAALARMRNLHGAGAVSVLAEHPDGRRTVISQFSKAQGPPGPAVATIARRAGMRVERPGPRSCT